MVFIKEVPLDYKSPKLDVVAAANVNSAGSRPTPDWTANELTYYP